MKKLIFIAAALLISAATLSAQNMAEATEIAQDANAALTDGNNEVALESFQKALDIASQCGEEGESLVNTCKEIIPKIMLSIGKGMYNEKDFEGAIAQFLATAEKAAEFGDEDIKAQAENLVLTAQKVQRSSAANALYAAKDYAGAAEAFEEILKNDPEDINTILKLGDCYNRSGKIDEAITVFENAYAAGQESKTKGTLSKLYVKKAQALLKGGKFAEAIEAAAKSNAYVENANAYKMAANAATKAGKVADAVEYYEKYLEVDPAAKDANDIKYTVAVLCQTKLNNKGKAIEYYNDLLLDAKYAEAAKAQIAALKK